MTSATVLQRLRSARLRPTIARISVLQVIEAAGTGRVSAEDVFRRMLLRGTRVSIGTVYRCIHQFEDGGLLLREWDGNRKALYRIKPDEAAEQVLYMVCRRSGCRMRVADPLLHERLRLAAHNLGVSLVGRQVLIEVDGVVLYQPAGERELEAVPS